MNGSQSRSFTAADVGARSQAMNLGVLALVILTLLVLTPLFAPLPKAALAGVIIVVAFGLLEPAGFRELARVDRRELALALLAGAIVVAVGMLAGVFVTVVLSLFLVALRAPSRAAPSWSGSRGPTASAASTRRGGSEPGRGLPVRRPALLRQRPAPGRRRDGRRHRRRHPVPCAGW